MKHAKLPKHAAPATADGAIRKDKAQAWAEGAESAAMTVPEALWHALGLILPPNPYTEEP